MFKLISICKFFVILNIYLINLFILYINFFFILFNILIFKKLNFVIHKCKFYQKLLFNTFLLNIVFKY